MGIGTETIRTSSFIVGYLTVLFLLCHLPIAFSSADIDNGVLGTPEVICGRDFVHFKVVTKKPFGGRVYVKGEFGNPKCVESVGTTRDGTEGEGEVGIGREEVGRKNGPKTEFDPPAKREGLKEENEHFGQSEHNPWRPIGTVPEGEEEEGEEAAGEGTARGRANAAEEATDEETLRQLLLELQKRHNHNTNGSQRTIPSHLPGFASADQLKRWRSFLKGKPGLDGQGFRRYGSRLSPDANGECPLVCPPCEEMKDKESNGKGAGGGGRQRRLAKEHSAELKVPLGECNTRRDRMANPPGMQVSFTIVVSFHPNFITRVDRAYNIQCAYQEPERILSAQIDVSSPPVIQISNQMESPQCEYRIHGQSDGAQVRNVRVGDIVEHQWICNGREANDERRNSDNGERMAQMFGLLVHDCFVDDGKSRREKVVDSKGCSKDPLILPTPVYSSDSLRATIVSSVAKFPDGDLVGFQCSITVCMRDLGKCDGFTPPNCSEKVAFASNVDQIHSSQNRTKRSAEAEKGMSKSLMDWELNSPLMTVFDLAEGPEEASAGDGLPPTAPPPRLLPSTALSVPQMCLSLPLFALLVSVSTFLVTSSNTVNLHLEMLLFRGFPFVFPLLLPISFQHSPAVQLCPKTRRYGQIQSPKCTSAVDPNLKPRVRLEKWFTRELWENLFPVSNQGWGEHPCMPYSFDAFIIAARYFPEFGATPNPSQSVRRITYNASEIQRRDVAAFFAHVLAESGQNNLRLFNSSSKLSPRVASECFYRGAFYHFFEGGPRSPLFPGRSDGKTFKDGDRCVEAGRYCKRSPELDFWYPCKERAESANASAFEGCYFGRGPLQLSWNYNYGQFRHFLRTEGVEVDLLQQPNQLLTRLDPPLAMLSALWFYNTPQPPKPSMHEWVPSKRNRRIGYEGSVFGPTNLVINNECDGEEENVHNFFPGPGGENRRIKAFKWFCAKLGVTTGPEETLSCKGMAEGFGPGQRLLSWQPDWANMWRRKPCDCVPASFAGVLPYFDPKHHPSRRWAKENERNRLRCVYSIYKKPELYRMNLDNSPCLGYTVKIKLTRSGTDRR
ncbi:hypothetical protein niasHS_014749 [Heterodera schachtii]|uniref:ZP domain-containing protein n=1 Tax=Heterodera schachtii TaxID=97005 RepID=A0ABD2IFI6_HETSC